MGKVSMVVCKIVALMLLMLFLHQIIRPSHSHHQHDDEHKRTVHSFPKPGHSEWFKSHTKTTQFNLRQAQRENADGGDSDSDDDMRLPVEEFINVSDADGDDLLNLPEFNEERIMDRDGKPSFKDVCNMHFDQEDDKDAPVTEMIEKLNDRLSLYNSIYNDDDEDL